jgi:hypothetical protein
MGHVRLGKLPTSRKWEDVVAYLAAADVNVAGLADAVFKATEQALARAAGDAAFVEVCWLLIKIPQAAKAADVAAALKEIGISVSSKPSLLDVVIGFDAAIETVIRSADEHITDLGEMARQAGISALYEVTQERLPSLWQPNNTDEVTTLATLASPDKFGELSQRFFTNLTERNILYYLDREWPKHLGSDKLAHSIGDMSLFENSVRRHCEETTLIMRTFSREWLANNVYVKDRPITRLQTRKFASYAIEKINSEMARRAAASAL